MSEKRFKLDFDNHSQGSIMDRQDKYGQYCRLYDFGEVGRQQIVDLLNELSEENGQLKKVNNLLYNENIQLRRILVNYKDLIYDVKYLEEKGVFDGEKDKKNIWDVEPVVEKHS